MKTLFLVVSLLVVSSAFGAGNEKLKKVSKKVEKRKDYCSPIDKMTGAAHCKKGSSDEKRVKKANKKLKAVSKKVEKRKDYCSPLDKMTKAAHCKK
jgi:predicted translin family RNA/ssDNA-binding protein